MNRNAIGIVIADDDEDDCLLTQEALAESRLAHPVHFVHDGIELLSYLREAFSPGSQLPKPGLVLLDLNMPRMDGREALQAIKDSPELRHLPVVVLTTSRAEADIYASYNLGVGGFITKPVTFDGLVEAMKMIQAYWFRLVELPMGGL